MPLVLRALYSLDQAPPDMATQDRLRPSRRDTYRIRTLRPSRVDNLQRFHTRRFWVPTRRRQPRMGPSAEVICTGQQHSQQRRPARQEALHGLTETVAAASDGAARGNRTYWLWGREVAGDIGFEVASGHGKPTEYRSGVAQSAEPPAVNR